NRRRRSSYGSPRRSALKKAVTRVELWLGRMIGSQPLIFDHAAQFFMPNDSRFRKLVDCWLERGLV
ncbi:hypothetical protein CISIN_1g043447mg, partial [Citrus sinensis]